MAVDFQRQRRIEVDAINGAVVRHGQRLGVPTPLNQMIYNTWSLWITITARRQERWAYATAPACYPARSRTATWGSDAYGHAGAGGAPLT